MKRSSVVDRTGIKAKIKNVFSRKMDFKYWLYRFKWNYYPSFRIVSKAPLHVDIEVTDACNLRCKMCIHGTDTFTDTGYIDPSLAYTIIDQCAQIGVYSIKFNFRGEPLLHKNLVDFVAYAKKKGILEVQFNTNGLPAGREKIKALIHAGLDRIIFSVDGATKETYESIRIGGNFEKLIHNIETFIDIKKSEKLSKPFIRVQMVVFPGKEEEAVQFIDYWSEKGVDNVAVIEKQERDADRGYPLKNGQKPIGRTFCDQPWQRLNVNRDGVVLMCCGDWYRKLKIGDARKEELKDIWNSRGLNKLRKKISESKLDEIPTCKTCFRPTTYKW